MQGAGKLLNNNTGRQQVSARAHVLQKSDYQCAAHCLSLLAAILQSVLAASNHSMHPAVICMGYSKETVPSDSMTGTAVDSHTNNILGKTQTYLPGCSELTVQSLTLRGSWMSILQAGIQHIVFSGLFDTRPYFHHLPLTPSGRRVPHYETKAEIKVCCSELSTPAI